MLTRQRIWAACWLGLMGAGLGWACTSSMPGPAVCSARLPCEKGQTCVVGRCREDGTMPVHGDAPRWMFEAVRSARVAEGARPTPEGDHVVLGRSELGEGMWLLDFEVNVPAEAFVQRAVLRADPGTGCERRPGKLTLHVADVEEGWDDKRLTRQRTPRMGPKMFAATVATTPPRPLRIDVTEIVRGWVSSKRRRHQGLAIFDSGTGVGACFSTGLAEGRGPRLDVYLKPEPKDAGADGGDAGDAASDGGPAPSASTRPGRSGR